MRKDFVTCFRMAAQAVVAPGLQKAAAPLCRTRADRAKKYRR